MPGLYLAAILFSFAGVTFLAHHHLPGVIGPRLARPVAAVLVVFLAFNAVGAARGWFASSPDWVVVQAPPGIPLEEPLLLAFLALFSVVLREAAALRLGERTAADDGVAPDRSRSGGRPGTDPVTGARAARGHGSPGADA